LLEIICLLFFEPAKVRTFFQPAKFYPKKINKNFFPRNKGDVNCQLFVTFADFFDNYYISMRTMIRHIKIGCMGTMFWLCAQSFCAQLNERLYITDSRLDTLRRGQFAVEVDEMSFFKDNEFNTTVQKGYTLPGFWLQLKAAYYPLSKLKFEAGVHSVWFWGTTRYPAFAYKDMSVWKGQDYAHNVHVLPYLRLHLALSPSLDIVLGDIYGGANHRLIEPLYNSELNLTSDPESGLQLLYRTSWTEIDMWVDWMSYIYKLDTHQEAFTAGFSTRLMLTPPKAPLHLYMPLQLLTQHRGGEIDATQTDVQTIVNASAGIGLTWNANRRVLKNINFEVDVAGYKCKKGYISDLVKGGGQYARLSAQLQDFNIQASYWDNRNYVSMFGSPFYGAVSTKEDGMFYECPSLLYFVADYVRPLGKGFAFGVKAESYYNLSGRMYSLDATTGARLYQPVAFGNNTNFTIGVCLRINPKFLIKQY